MIIFPTFPPFPSLISIEREIIHKAVKGDNDARSWLYRQHVHAMYNICMRMTGNAQNARDVLQDAFILAFKHLKQVKEPAQFGGWLRRIVINECIRFSKRSASWQSLDDNLHELAPDEEPDLRTNISMELIHAAIKQLPEGCRQIFVLYVLEDFSHKEIANSLGISESTSKSQYQRARKLLQERLLKKLPHNG